MAGSTDMVADVDSSTFTSPVTSTVSGVEFTVSLLMSTPLLSSQISFVASEMVNGLDLVCISLAPGSTVQEMTTLQVISGKSA